MSAATAATTMRTPAARLRLGIGRADITPPGDAYHRNWGAAAHDAAEGIHRPLTATAAVVRSLTGDDELVLVCLDLGWLRTQEMTALRQAVCRDTGAAPERLLLSFSHTHSAINLDLTRTDEPGGHRIRPYLDSLPARIAEAVEQARSAVAPVHLSFAWGRCDLAMQRDAWDEERQLYVCGPNPDAPADDRILVVRVTDDRGGMVGSLINYGCHPTTLAWENRLISPDYVGATRSTVEEATGAPCLFALSPCGDLGPRDGFVGTPETADRNGRQLGYAALSALESLPPADTEMAYTGALVSGATLGVWRHRPLSEQRRGRVETMRAVELLLELPCREMPSQQELEALLDDWRRQEQEAAAAGEAERAAECRARVERVRRSLRRLEERPADGRTQYRVQMWQLGEGVLVGVGGEPYSLLRRALVERVPETPVVVAELCNEPHSYILPAELCGRGHYQDECRTLAAGALEEIIDAIGRQLDAWDLS